MGTRALAQRTRGRPVVNIGPVTDFDAPTSLVAAAKGDQDAWNAIVAHYSGLVWPFVAVGAIGTQSVRGDNVLPPATSFELLMSKPFGPYGKF